MEHEPIADPPPAPEPTFEETDPPVVVAQPAATAPAHAQAPTRARAHKGVHASSNVL